MIRIDDIIKAAATAAQEFGLKSVILFGSYADGSATDESDVDLFVEFNADRVSLITLASLKLRFEELLGIEVDVVRLPLCEEAMIKADKVVELYAA